MAEHVTDCFTTWQPIILVLQQWTAAKTRIAHGHQQWHCYEDDKISRHQKSQNLSYPYLCIYCINWGDVQNFAMLGLRGHPQYGSLNTCRQNGEKMAIWSHVMYQITVLQKTMTDSSFHLLIIKPRPTSWRYCMCHLWTDHTDQWSYIIYNILRPTDRVSHNTLCIGVSVFFCSLCNMHIFHVLLVSNKTLISIYMYVNKIFFF